MKTTAILALGVLLAVGCSDDRILRSAGEPCQSDSQCESNLCYEAHCIDPLADGDPPEATDCAALCAELFACGLSDEGTEEECVVFCEDNGVYFPPRIGACAEVHLADERCDEAAFEDCAKTAAALLRLAATLGQVYARRGEA